MLHKLASLTMMLMRHNVKTEKVMTSYLYLKRIFANVLSSKKCKIEIHFSANDLHYGHIKTFKEQNCLGLS